MPSHHRPQDLAARGRAWIAAFNSRDLERVLALYAETAEMSSDRIPAFGFDASGTLRGKDNLRAYWGKALGLLPDLHFTWSTSWSARTARSWSTTTSAARGSANICGSTPTA